MMARRHVARYTSPVSHIRRTFRALLTTIGLLPCYDLAPRSSLFLGFRPGQTRRGSIRPCHITRLLSAGVRLALARLTGSELQKIS